MEKRNRPMEIQSSSLRDHLRQHQIGFRPGNFSKTNYILSPKSKLVVVKTITSRQDRRPKLVK